MRKDQSVYSNPTAPDVEIHCLFGNKAGSSTVERYDLYKIHSVKKCVMDTRSRC